MAAHLMGDQEVVDLVRCPHEGEDTDAYMLDTDTESEEEDVIME